MWTRIHSENLARASRYTADARARYFHLPIGHRQRLRADDRT
jgi:hypothetical protein